MKILHLLFSKGWGGLERYAIKSAALVAEKGHQVMFLARTGTKVADALPSYPLIESHSWRPLKYIDIGAMMALRSLVKREKIDIVHVHHSADLGLVAPALFHFDSPRLIFSSYMQTPAPKKDLYHRLEYARVDRLIVSCQFLKENAAAMLPVTPERVAVLPYGLDMTRFDRDRVAKGSFRSAYGISPNAPLIGVIARLDPGKGQIETINAAPRILARHPEARVVLVGDETEESQGTFLPLLQRQVERLGLTGKVIFTGFAADTATVLADLDVFVLPTHSETFSLGCLEAMAMGVAVAGTDAGGTPEMLDQGACGLLFEPRNATALADAAITLLDDPKLRSTLGARGRQRVRGVYEQGAVTDALIGIYQD